MTTEDATATTATPAAAETDARQRHRGAFLRWAWSLLRLDFVGIPFGALFFCLSLTPSLLPRDWLFQGLIGGVNAAIGYGLGVLVGKVLFAFVFRDRAWWPPAGWVLSVLKAGVVAVSAAACILMLIPAARWQRQISQLMGVEGPQTPGYLRTVLVSVAVGALVIGIARVLRDLSRLLTRLFKRRFHMHDEVALLFGVAIVVALVVMLVNGVLIRGFFAVTAAAARPQDEQTRAGVTQPTAPERSGSPASFASWDSLGYQGRNFVAGGPSVADLTALNGPGAREPVRIYAGLGTADTDEGRMNTLVRELDRTGAADREILVISPTTGTGWINPVAAASLEMMYNGDTAIVGSQYSYLPSWISFLADKDKAVAAGRLLVTTVHRWWSALPPDRRPRLALYGESLGSMAGQGAFGFLPDISELGFDSVLWVGPPNASSLWRALTDRRDPGTFEVEPRYDGGRTVRFSMGDPPSEIAAVAKPPWPGTRVLFLQHPSDPIVWWSPDLLFKKPDWLKEPVPPGRSSAMRWYPIVTFWQVGADMTNAVGVPGGHGHNYGLTVLDGWAAVAPPAGWTAADTERVRAVLQQRQFGSA
ncbi:alpha/beta hydrolase [Mycobacterium sp. MYCO198283]|uniref:alpha/beta hydrolase n=1 Tax=Mycobacterium sp. MYCO198283 TaxID=2883505 RepID=UPI001E4771FF|nr:alpha/beta hydrolase [Mycobacterium sp. MYCO198283]MCG5431296.1 alpha/beta hydrolase [Mycobacterium sp. MYCO198283]